MWADGPNGINSWYDDDRLGPYYRQMRPYLRDVEPSSEALLRTNQILDIIYEENDRYFLDNQPIDVTLSNVERRSNAAIADLR